MSTKKRWTVFDSLKSKFLELIKKIVETQSAYGTKLKVQKLNFWKVLQFNYKFSCTI